MDNKFLFLSHKDIHSILRDNYSFVIESVEDSLRMLLQKTAIQTDKISHIFNA